MSWINSRRVNTLTPRSLARNPVLWVQAVSSISLHFSYQNRHIFLTFFSSAFLWSLLQLLFPYLLLLLPLPCLFLFLETFPSPLWLRPTATQLMALTGPLACCKWIHVSPDEQFLFPVFITWLFTWGSIALYYLQKQRHCFCCSEQS